jgi:tetratricopeptide (TPR) repeat protein
MENLIITAPMNRTAPTIVAALLAAQAIVGCSSTPPIESTTATAQHYIDFNQCREAADLIKPVVDKWPGEWQAQLIYGRAELCLGDLPEARHALEAANARNPSNMDVVFALADCMERQKDIPELYLLLRNAGAEFRSVEAYVKLAAIAGSVGDIDSQKTALLAAIELDEGYGQKRIISPYLQMAILQEKLGDQAEALRRLRQAYGVNPDDPRVQSMLLARGQVLGPTLALPGGI